MYRRSVRTALVLLAAAAATACGKAPDPPPPGLPSPPAPGSARPARLESKAFADLASALGATIPDDARVIGFGELHARTDRAQVPSALSRFTREAMPALAPRASDLVIETWVQDKGCAAVASDATARVEMTMRRPQETRSEIAQLADAARAAHVQPRAMTVTCDDYARIAPPGEEVDPAAMLTLTTHELARVTTAALAQRELSPDDPRTRVLVYGGALHNDRFPEPGTEEWSYAAAIDARSHDHFVELDLIVPEYAEGDPASQRQPWYPLVTAADAQVHVWQRGERSFVVVLAKTPPPAPGAAP